eukprot:3459952-Lingulodinium_polyedra.AAC.1
MVAARAASSSRGVPPRGLAAVSSSQGRGHQCPGAWRAYKVAQPPMRRDGARGRRDRLSGSRSGAANARGRART